ncbi:MAG: hypothetical protein IT497_11110 [Ottowia sp.]|nr:hypothetical protein [Ottowia sp.]
MPYLNNVANKIGALVLLGATIYSPLTWCVAEEITIPRYFDAVKSRFSKVATEGQWTMTLSGYAYHSRDKYSESQLQKLNSLTWGAGIGKTMRNEHGNDELLYLIGIRDSNRHPQWMLGYAYQWIYPSSVGIELGLGASALLIRRVGWFDGIPFPAVLPIVSIGTRHAKLMATFVPDLSQSKGSVLWLFANFQFN